MVKKIVEAYEPVRCFIANLEANDRMRGEGVDLALQCFSKIEVTMKTLAPGVLARSTVNVT